MASLKVPGWTICSLGSAGRPNTTYSTSVSLAELTEVAARSVGVYTGVILMGLALLIKGKAFLKKNAFPLASGIARPSPQVIPGGSGHNYETYPMYPAISQDIPIL